MSRIVKNTTGNLFIIFIIFSLVTGWWFSGWPQIWQNPPVPPEIQEVQAAETVIFIVSDTAPDGHSCGANCFTIPTDWTDTNTIEVIGGGGSGADGDAGGGGGGGYSASNLIGLSPLDTVYFQVGPGGIGVSTNNGPGDNASNTWFNAVDYAACQSAGSGSCVGAEGGKGGTVSTGGLGGSAAVGVGTTKYDGGKGGDGCAVGDSGGGGGGAGGPNGDGIGNAGGIGTGDTRPGLGGGGGGGGGGSPGTVGTVAGGDTTCGTTDDTEPVLGGLGGTNYLGDGAGIRGDVDGGAGSAGGGGGGGDDTGFGGAGGAGIDWDAVHGSGGGGGGGGDADYGGTGGLYGGGGGGGETNSVASNGGGAQGIIVITYTQALPNQIPTVSNVVLNNGVATINLIENSTKPITATGTVSDGNTHLDITSVIGKIYRSGVANGSDCNANNNNCYEATCATSSPAGDDCVATCNYNVYFHAEPTDAGDYSLEHWVAWIKAIDGDNASGTATSSLQTIQMNTLTALDVSESINYGSLAPNQTDETLDKVVTATTTGNVAINAFISGTGMYTDYPGLSGYYIDSIAQHYATDTVAYASGYVLSSTTPATLEFESTKPITSPSDQAQQVYWGISIPAEQALGDYTGENTFTADSN